MSTDPHAPAPESLQNSAQAGLDDAAQLPHPSPAEPLDAQAVLAELHEAFVTFRRPFPRAAVALAEQHRAVVAPWLVQVLEDLARDPSPALAADDYMLHNFAVLLLGHWRDTRAYRPMLALARLPYPTIDQMFGDAWFETFGRALAGVCDGDLAPLAAVVEDASVNSWARTPLLDAWALRVIEGDAPAAPLEDCLLALGEREAAWRRDSAAEVAEDDDNPPFMDMVANVAADLCSERLRAPVLAWFDAELIDPTRIGRSEFEGDTQGSMAQQRETRRAQGRSYLRDPESESRWWAGYQDAPERRQPSPPVVQPIVRETPKIGRNDPCPCGSGRKFKKCHGAT